MVDRQINSPFPSPGAFVVLLWLSLVLIDSSRSPPAVIGMRDYLR
jgi:hypothetical protein